MRLEDFANRRLLIILLALILAGCSGGGGGSNVTVSGAGSSTYASSQQKIVFVGASSIAYGNWSSYFGIPIENDGVPGIGSATLISTITNYCVSKPDKLFLMIGSNDVQKLQQDIVVDNISIIIDKIKAASPSTQIFVQSILPLKHASYNILIERLNPQIQALCDRKGVRFISLYGLFKSQTTLINLSLYRADGLHLNEAGYKVWTDAIRGSVLS